jgi:3-oxoacyl-[acyl-carrier protein] reductase
MPFQGKNVLVTGAAAGFGEAIATRFREAGATVILMDLDGLRVHDVAERIGGIAVQGDVTVIADVQRATAAAGNRIDIAVNNAGWSHSNKSMNDVTEGEFDRLFGVNVKSIYVTSQIIVPLMRAAGGGVILNIGSTAGLRPRPGLTWYNASKGAVNLLSQSMAVELAPDRIRVNCIAPVVGRTAMLNAFLGEGGEADSERKMQAFVNSIPLGRLCEPSDVAAACLFLASADAEFITGVVLPVDGGRTV